MPSQSKEKCFAYALTTCKVLTEMLCRTRTTPCPFYKVEFSDKSKKPKFVDRDSMFMSAPWKQIRAEHLAEFPYCHVCKGFGRHTKAGWVSHMNGVDIDNPDQFYDKSNLISLCQSCLGKKRIAKRNAHKANPV